MSLARTEDLRLVTVDCRQHGRTAVDEQHTQDCPDGPHCGLCWHGWPVPEHLRSDGAYIAYRAQVEAEYHARQAVEAEQAARAAALYGERYGDAAVPAERLIGRAS